MPFLESFELINIFIGSVSVLIVFLIKRFISSVDKLKEAIVSLRTELSNNTIHIQMAFNVLEKLEKRIEQIERRAKKVKTGH
jgi:hypothetical protein